MPSVLPNLSATTCKTINATVLKTGYPAQIGSYNNTKKDPSFMEAESKYQIKRMGGWKGWGVDCIEMHR